jgi:uncharacterized damage-inducible protein DinB
MMADVFRHFYDYHFSENRNIWDAYITPLSDEQFTQDVGYSSVTTPPWPSPRRGGEKGIRLR